ncbi:MAG TPA: trypsin-like serine protease [Oligoflexus sp.]|uniref:trypsin-like serine protease n=1 Tax=Oligoflexus sp. TaxID=1971216 RepID=UPI002D4C7018|nr:trypsin-like serine protease [Oligoflexus sp.]HYX35790.1 trypsin-like serine protease [Oligoflexus sp.]
MNNQKVLSVLACCRLKRKIIAILTLFSYLVTGCGVPPPARSTAKAIIGVDNRIEERVPYSSWPVGVLSKSERVGGKTAVCYATLTAPDVVTTAAHCLDGVMIERTDGSFELLDDVEVSFSSTEKRKVRAVYDIYEDLDIAQLQLVSPVDLSSVYPAQLDSYDSSEPLRIVTAPRQVTITEWVTPSPSSQPESKPELTPIPGRGGSSSCLETPPDAWTCETMPWTQGCKCSGSQNLEPFEHSYMVWQRYTQETRNHALDQQGFLSYDLDTVPGYSGAPIFQNGQLVGIHVGYDPELRKNVGIALTEIFSSYNLAREQRLESIRPEGISIKKIKKWAKKVGKDPIKTLTGTLADIDPTNPNGSLSVAAGADSLTKSVKELDVMSRNSEFRQALGRIDPDHRIGKYLEDNKQTIVVIAAIALCAYGGYYLISSGAVTGEAAFVVEVGGQSIKVASAKFAAAGSGAVGGAGAFIATGGIAEDPADHGGYSPGTDITSVTTAGAPGSTAQPTDNGGQGSSGSLPPEKYKKGRKVTTKGHPVGSQDHLLDVMSRIANLSNLDPKLFEKGINPEILGKLNQMLKGGQIDPLALKELRMALDTVAKSVLSTDPGLSEDIDDIADTIAMQNEYGLGVPMTSEVRKMSPAQQEALKNRQLDASQRFVQERLEEADGRGVRAEGMQFMIAAGVYKAHQSFDELNRYTTFYTQRALQYTYEFANFAVDFTTFPSLMKNANDYVQSQPRDPRTGAPIYGTQNSMDFAIDLLSIIVPKWLRKGQKAADIFKDFRPYVNTASDGGKFLDKGLKTADQVYDDLLKAGVRAEDLDDVLDSAKKIGLDADDLKKFKNDPSFITKPLKDLVGDGPDVLKTTQAEVDPIRVDRYISDLKAGIKIEPIEVFVKPDGSKVISDGHHRYVASRITGKAVPTRESPGLVSGIAWKDVEFKNLLLED